jgi:hypothetical protein
LGILGSLLRRLQSKWPQTPYLAAFRDLCSLYGAQFPVSASPYNYHQKKAGVDFVQSAEILLVCSLGGFDIRSSIRHVCSLGTPQGLERSSEWHAFFAIPSLLTAAMSGTLLWLWSQEERRIKSTIKGTAISFITSIVFSLVDCTASRSEADAQDAFAGIALLHVIFFATVSGAIVGALRLFARPVRPQVAGNNTLSQ